MFAVLFGCQWVLGIVFAMVLSPLTWTGDESSIHWHVYAAVFGGGLIAAYPIWRIFKSPGAVQNRMIVAISQSFFSILFIHFTGGRIETHFHIFGSLAFLALYQDYRPILIATAITALDHLLRGYFWPQSVYGVLWATPWRALEHAAWVLFEDLFLLTGLKYRARDLWMISENQAKLETLLQKVEAEVERRTSELKAALRTVEEQQAALASTAKLSALGEMAGGIAHEINTPLATIQLRTEEIADSLQEGDFEKKATVESLSAIQDTVQRIAKIIRGLRSFARDGKNDPPVESELSQIVNDTFGLCQERFHNHGIRLTYIPRGELLVTCRPTQLSQVLLNLLNNAFDAVQDLSDKWVLVETFGIDDQNSACISVTDSGTGITPEVRQKIMQPFFTTKELGKGTGLGLSISKGIVEQHGGGLRLDPDSHHTRFIIRLPRALARDAA